MGRGMKQILQLLILLSSLVIFLTACGGVCYDLAEKVCACETGASAQEACKKKLDMKKSHAQLTLAEDPKVCKKALQTCSCEILATKQYDQCGLTPESNE